MSTVDRVRAATEATAATVREIRPLALPEEPATARPHWFPRFGRPRSGWLIPLAAAAAVIVVAATLVAVRTLAGAGGGSRPAPASTSTKGLPAGVPRYYVADNVNASGSGGTVIVGDTRTGQRLANFKPPSNVEFGTVAAAADDRTFVVEARESSATTPTWSWLTAWYVIRLNPGTAQPARLTRIPVAAPLVTAAVTGLTVSPDGGTFAVVFRAASTSNYEVTSADPVTLRTYSVATGQVLRTWTAPLSQRDLQAFGDLSWLDDGRTLAFAYPANQAKRYVRTLDTTAGGHDLLADSRTVFAVPTGHACDSMVLMTSDGKSVICGNFATNSGWCATGQLALTAYSVATGRLDRVLYRYQGKCQLGTAIVVWARSAALAVGWISVTKPAPLPSGGPTVNLIGVAGPGGFTPLPVPLAGVPSGTAGAIAF